MCVCVGGMRLLLTERLKQYNKRTLLFFLYSVQCQHDQTSLTDNVQFKSYVLGWPTKPSTYQRAAT